MMKRHFNIAGPCLPGEHYLLPTLARCPELAGLIQAKQYFVIHAARQAGKTTLLKALAAEINGGTERVALYCSLESVQGLNEPERGIPAILRALQESIRWSRTCQGIPPITADLANYSQGLKAFLSDLCRKNLPG